MKKANANERRHMDRVAGLGCVICGSPAEVHHIREGQGMSQRAQHYLTVPLCPEHHRGNQGIHMLGPSMFYTRYKCDELDLLAMTIERMSL